MKITTITFKEAPHERPQLLYPSGLGRVRDLIAMLPELKKQNVIFFLDGSVPQNYEAVQILSSLGVYSGILIDERADWERLTDLMYYALCGRVLHAPVEPFQFVFDTYERGALVDYGRVFDGESFLHTDDTDETDLHRFFFYEATECGACEGWRICLGKYATLKDKTGCKTFTTEWLQIIENLKFNHYNH